MLGTRKKTFLSTSNVRILQSVWSTCLKLFAYVLLVVLGKILQLKVQKTIFFSFGLLKLEMANLRYF
jgi:hypothetical protein